jgi:DNA-binding transcriptional ArsR family regulator
LRKFTFREGRVLELAPFSPFVPVPLAYIDAILPALTDAELRVLLVILRQTLGWRDADNFDARKGRDWITQSQFQKRTGKSRDALSRAIKGLVEKRLIHVESRAGEPLETPQKRRRERDRIYYRLDLTSLERVQSNQNNQAES